MLATALAALGLAWLWPMVVGPQVPLSPILVAIIAGIALSGMAHRRPGWRPGIEVATGPLLKLAVMLIGLRLSLAQLGMLGALALPMILGALAAGLGSMWVLHRLFGLERKLSALLAVGAAICGASAIAATAPVLRARPEHTAYALACVALFGLGATLLYPWLLQAVLGDGLRIGLVLGASVHDTAQVTAAAMLHEQTYGGTETLAAATVTKLLRNLSMLVVIPAVAWWALRGEDHPSARPAFPLFVLGFVALAALRSAGDLVAGDAAGWAMFLSLGNALSGFLFAMAMAAIGMQIRLSALRALGALPAVAALITALVMGALALTIVALSG